MNTHRLFRKKNLEEYTGNDSSLVLNPGLDLSLELLENLGLRLGLRLRLGMLATLTIVFDSK